MRYKLAGPSSQFNTTLANGVAIEILGLSNYPPDEEAWWGPDGTRLVEAPYSDPLDRPYPRIGEKGYRLSVRFAGIGGREMVGRFCPLSFRTTSGGAFRSDSRLNKRKVNVVYVNERIDEVVVSMGIATDEKREYCHFKVGVCDGDWKEEYRIETDRPDDGVEWIIFRNVALKPVP